MKELTKDFKDNEVEIVVEKEHRKEIRLIGQQRKISGLTLWEFNVKTMELNPAQFKKEDVEVTGLRLKKDLTLKHNRVHTNEACLYFQALNKRSALKKLLRAGIIKVAKKKQ